MMIQIEGQMSIFDFLKPVVEFKPLYELVKWGSLTAGGKERIKSYFASEMNKTKRVSFLKDEYGLCGYGCPPKESDTPYIQGFDFGMRQLHGGDVYLKWYNPEDKEIHEETCNYSQLCDVISECIKNDDY